jgi:hypothetical protein
MKLHPSVFLIVLRGRNVATVSYLRGLLFNVTVTTGVPEEVAELMAHLPSREANIARTEGISFTAIEDLIIE